MSLGFAACDDFDLPNPPAQSNPEVAPFETDNINVEADAQAPSPLELQGYNDRSELVPVGILSLENWPESYKLNLKLNVKATENGTAVAIPCTLSDSLVCVKADDLNAAYASFTKDPKAAKVYVNYSATASLTETAGNYYIGGPDYTFGNYTIDIKPFDPETVIEDTYYLVSGDKRIQLTHSDKSPYDDPVFTTVVEIPEDAGSFEWAVTGASGTPVYGGEGESGDLSTEVTGSISLHGPVMFTFNMEAKTFDIMVAYPFIYTPGNANGWNQGNSSRLTTTDYMKYQGFIHADGEFKFCATLDWTKNWGMGADEGKLAEGGDNITVVQDGCYFSKVDIVELTYSIAFIENCGVIGDATPGGWDAQTNLAQDSSNPMIFTGKIHFKSEGSWKIRFNDNWDINLGDKMTDLTVGGENMPTPGEGDYNVTLNLTTLPYVVTVTK